MAKNKRPRWYFSLRSPYSWFAYRDLLAHYPDVLDAVEWLPMWEPDERITAELAEVGVELPYVPMSRAKGLYILQDTRRLSKARGLSMTWPIDKAPVWEVAHLAYLAAEQEGHGKQFVDATYRARWERGENISDPEVIAEVAREIGLDPVRLAGAAEDPELRAEGVQRLKALSKDGVFGVPMFINGFDKFWGTDRLLDFVAAVRGNGVVQPEPVQQPVLATVGGDAGHAGGCG